MATWEEWIQGVGQTVVDGYAAQQSASQTQNYELQKLKIEALGQAGLYTEGQAGIKPATAGGINTTALLIAGAVLLGFMMMKD